MTGTDGDAGALAPPKGVAKIGVIAGAAPTPGTPPIDPGLACELPVPPAVPPEPVPVPAVLPVSGSAGPLEPEQPWKPTANATIARRAQNHRIPR